MHWSQSLSLKVLVVFLLATAALLLVLSLTLGMTFRGLFSDNVKPYFTRHLMGLQNQVGVPPDINVAKRLSEQNGVNIEIDAPGYRWSSTGEFLNAEQLEVKLQRVDKSGIVAEAGFYQGNFVLRTFNQDHIISFMLTEKISPTLNRNEIWFALGATVVILTLLYGVISYLFRPVAAIERGVRRIGNGEVSYRLVVPRNDEIGLLAASINKMADNIEDMLEAKRQLLLAISHELRTPITRSKIALSMLDDEAIKKHVSEDLDEMNRLIHELLESERLRGNHTPLSLHRANLNDIVYQVQGRYFDDAPLLLDLDDSVPDFIVDAGRIGLAVKNVIKNALTANLSPDDTVLVATYANDQQVFISVSDSGCGIEEKNIAQLTEPFYRADTSRQRRTGGFGIGLYLIKAIVDAHHGTLQVDSLLNVGTTVTLAFPIKPRVDEGNSEAVPETGPTDDYTT